jgi:5'-nucleotidase
MIINWADIDTVLLDMDGTLLDLHYDNYFWAHYLPKRYAEIHHIALTDAEAQLHQHIRSIEGTLNWYCLDYWSNSLGLDIGALKAESAIIDKIQERPHAEVFLQYLKAQHKTVILITNAHPIGLDIKLDKTCIGAYLDQIISSHQFQQPKENQAFWLHLQEHSSFDPKRTLFIDDNHAILRSAQEYGIKFTLGIHQPDSQIIRRLDNTPAIYHFTEIMY